MTAAAPVFDWRTLLRDFPNRPNAWRVLAINLVPVIGVAVFGWSTSHIVLAYWPDLLLTVAAMVGVLSVHAIDETQPETRGFKRAMAIAMIFAFALPFVGMPALIS